MSLSMIWDHLSLVLSALVLAVAAGVPLGLLAYLSPKFGKVILWVVDLIQTIPALALLGPDGGRIQLEYGLEMAGQDAGVTRFTLMARPIEGE